MVPNGIPKSVIVPKAAAFVHVVTAFTTIITTTTATVASAAATFTTTATINTILTAYIPFPKILPHFCLTPHHTYSFLFLLPFHRTSSYQQLTFRGGKNQ